MPRPISDDICSASAWTDYRAPPRMFTERQIRDVITLDTSIIEIIEDSFRDLAVGNVVQPPVLQMMIGDNFGQTCIKGAWLAGTGQYVIKLSSTFPPLPGLDKSEANGAMVVLNASSGRIDALLLDNGYLTQIRTAAAGAVAAKHLAQPDSNTLLVVGAGKQAILQAQAVSLVRPIYQVLVWARRPSSAQVAAAQLSHLITAECRAVSSLDDAICQADIVVCATKAREPVLLGRHARKGLHITVMGADAPGKVELDPVLAVRADLYVCDLVAQCWDIGDLRSVAEAGLAGVIHPPVEMSAVVTGAASARRSAADLTIADLTGLGVQDLAIAIEALRRLQTSNGSA